MEEQYPKYPTRAMELLQDYVLMPLVLMILALVEGAVFLVFVLLLFWLFRGV